MNRLEIHLIIDEHGQLQIVCPPNKAMAVLVALEDAAEAIKRQVAQKEMGGAVQATSPAELGSLLAKHRR